MGGRGLVLVSSEGAFVESAQTLTPAKISERKWGRVEEGWGAGRGG